MKSPSGFFHACEHLNAAFGSPLARLSQFPVAADTDNTGETAHAGFADFHFVAKEAGCAFAP